MKNDDNYVDLLKRYHALQRAHDDELSMLQSEHNKELRTMERWHDKATQHIKEEASRWKAQAQETEKTLDYRLKDPDNPLIAEFEGFSYTYHRLQMSSDNYRYIRRQYCNAMSSMVRQVNIAVQDGYSWICYDTHVCSERNEVPATRADYVSAVNAAIQYMVDPTYEPR